MKGDVGCFVAQCLTCQQVKVEHWLPASKLQQLPILHWKLENIAMDFIVGFPRSQTGHDVIWVIVDCLTKSTHFLLIHSTWLWAKLAWVYIDEVVRLHGVSVSIVADQDPRFVSQFWKSLYETLGMPRFSTTYHPQSDGQ